VEETGTVATASDETPAARVARLERELAEARAEAEKQAGVDAARAVVAWLEGTGDQPTEDEAALVVELLQEAGLVRAGAPSGRPRRGAGGPDHVPFDAEKALAWLAYNSPARIQEINKHANGDGRRMAGTISDMRALESRGVSSTGKGPATFYSYRGPERRG
jgi:hypothetical protein